MKRFEQDSVNKVYKSDFVDGKRSRLRPKNLWKEAVDRDSTALGHGNWQTVAINRISYRRKQSLWIQAIKRDKIEFYCSWRHHYDKLVEI